MTTQTENLLMSSVKQAVGFLKLPAPLDRSTLSKLGKECSMVARIHRRPTGTVEVFGEAWPTEKTYTHDVLREVFRLNPATAPYMPANIKPIGEVVL